MGKNGPKTGFFEFIGNLVINFFGIWSIKKIFNICCNLAKFHTCEKSGSWDIGLNALDKSDYSIFKVTISLEQNHEKV